MNVSIGVILGFIATGLGIIATGLTILWKLHEFSKLYATSEHVKEQGERTQEQFKRVEAVLSQHDSRINNNAAMIRTLEICQARQTTVLEGLDKTLSRLTDTIDDLRDQIIGVPHKPGCSVASDTPGPYREPRRYSLSDSEVRWIDGKRRGEVIGE